MNSHSTTDSDAPPPGRDRRGGAGRSRRLKYAGAGLALAAGSVVGALVAVPAVSSAQEATTTTAAPGAPAPDGAARRPRGPHTVDGKAEEALTGDAKARVEAATMAAYPGATIERAESDVDGATYEAHITTADGQHLTVLFDADFNVSGTEQGRGGPGGSCGPGGSGPAPTGDGTGG
jgi:hypothetical protein